MSSSNVNNEEFRMKFNLENYLKARKINRNEGENLKKTIDKYQIIAKKNSVQHEAELFELRKQVYRNSSFKRESILHEKYLGLGYDPPLKIVSLSKNFSNISLSNFKTKINKSKSYDSLVSKKKKR